MPGVLRKVRSLSRGRLLLFAAVLAITAIGAAASLVVFRGRRKADLQRRPMRRMLPQVERAVAHCDLVYTWVNGSDPLQLHKKADIASAETVRPGGGDKDSGELRASLRSVARHMRWHKGRVVIVSPGHLPPWLTLAHPRLDVVHQDALTDDDRERFTVNTNTVENHLHALPNATPLLLQFNDDYMLGRPTAPTDFFTPQGGPVIRFEKGVVRGGTNRSKELQRERKSIWAAGVFRTVGAVEDVLGKRRRHYIKHAPFSYCTKILKGLRRRHEAHLHGAAVRNQHRSADDFYLPFLHAFTALERPALAYDAIPAKDKAARLPNCAPPEARVESVESRYFKLTDNATQVNSTLSLIDALRPKFFNINDGFSKPAVGKRMAKFLGQMFPRPSPFEVHPSVPCPHGRDLCARAKVLEGAADVVIASTSCAALCGQLRSIAGTGFTRLAAASRVFVVGGARPETCQCRGGRRPYHHHHYRLTSAVLGSEADTATASVVVRSLCASAPAPDACGGNSSGRPLVVVSGADLALGQAVMARHLKPFTVTLVSGALLSGLRAVVRRKGDGGGAGDALLALTLATPTSYLAVWPVPAAASALAFEKRYVAPIHPDLAPGLAASDVVYTWVNGSDPLHLFKKGVARNAKQPLTADGRDRDSGELRMSLRSVAAHMRWHTGRVVIVSPGHVPAWLDLAGPAEVVHQDALADDEQERFTFNSNTVENHLHALPGATPMMIHFNDDYLLGRPTAATDFFTAEGGGVFRFEGGVVDGGTRRSLELEKRRSGIWVAGVYRSVGLVEDQVGPAARHYIKHAPFVYCRKMLQGLRHKHEAALHKAAAEHPFRHWADILLPFLYAFTALERPALALDALPLEEAAQLPDCAPAEGRVDFAESVFFKVTDDEAQVTETLGRINKTRPKFFNINDSFKRVGVGQRMADFLGQMFPRPSPFEVHPSVPCPHGRDLCARAKVLEGAADVVIASTSCAALCGQLRSIAGTGFTRLAAASRVFVVGGARPGTCQCRGGRRPEFPQRTAPGPAVVGSHASVSANESSVPLVLEELCASTPAPDACGGNSSGRPLVVVSGADLALGQAVMARHLKPFTATLASGAYVPGMEAVVRRKGDGGGAGDALLALTLATPTSYLAVWPLPPTPMWEAPLVG